MSKILTMKAFVSYAKDDENAVRPMLAALANEGVQLFLPGEQILPGEPWLDKIEGAIQSADAFVVFISPKSTRSDWVQHELAVALTQITKGKHKKIIPVLLNKDAEIPFFLKNVQYLDMSSERARTENQDKLLRSVMGPGTSASEYRQDQAVRKQVLDTEAEVLSAQKRQFQVDRLRTNVSLVASLLTVLIAGVAAISGLLATDIKINLVSTLLIGFVSSIVGSGLFTLIKRTLDRRVRGGRDEVQ
jgi:TIR domain